MNGKIKYAILPALAVSLCCGCSFLVKKQAVQEASFQDLYTLTPSQWEAAEAKPITAGSKKIPYRYEFMYEPSVIWSVISLHDSIKNIKTTEDVLRFDISDKHARAAGKTLAFLSKRMKVYSKLIEEGNRRGSEKKWARNTADLLVELHSLFGVVNPDRAKRGDFNMDDSTAWFILPIIDLVYSLAEGGEITDSIEGHADTLVQTEKTMIFAVLKLSFIMGGDRIEPGIEEEIYDILDSAKGASRQRKLVSQKLRSLASVAGEKEEKVGALNMDVGKRISTAAMVFEAMAGYCYQWNKIDYVALEIRSLGDSKVIGVEINIKPGKKLVLKAPHFASPRLIFEGKNRIVVQPDPEHQGRLVVLFTAEEGGSAVIQLPKIVSIPSRLFFLPFDNARLMEVRVVSTVEPPNVKKRVIVAYMDAVGKEDGRRMLIVETTKEPIIELVDEVREVYKGDLKKYTIQYYNDRKVYEFKKKKRKAAGLRALK